MPKPKPNVPNIQKSNPLRKPVRIIDNPPQKIVVPRAQGEGGTRLAKHGEDALSVRQLSARAWGQRVRVR